MEDLGIPRSSDSLCKTAGSEPFAASCRPDPLPEALRSGHPPPTQVAGLGCLSDWRGPAGAGPLSVDSDPERVGAARGAPVHGDELVARSDEIEDALHVGAEVQARYRHTGDADPMCQVTHGEAGGIHDTAPGIAGQAVA